MTDAKIPRLAAGSTAGGYDYAEQLKKESSLYDEVSGKAKNYHPILTKLGTINLLL